MTRDELRLTPSAISKRVARGALTRRYPGVYSYGRGELSDEAQWRAAVLACGEGAALAHLSSVVLFDCSRWPVGEPHVIVPRRHRAVEGITIHHALGLDPRDVTVFKGIPTTTVARMLLDLSASHTEYQVAYVINRAAYKHRFDLQATLRARARAKGHPGAGVLARAIDLYLAGSAGTRSDLEDQFLELVRGFPVPLVNMEHLGYEIDFRWPERRLAVEVDGNHRRPRDKRNDPARDRVLRDAGYTVVRFTGPELPIAPARLAPYF
ncbi:endonuclease domain-containing protein [Solirubrobacter taibaiensis]|nr:endonuclease domain-containing protein [Solirubrobacter taibaiensis]